MSAFLCDAYHIGRMAAYIAQDRDSQGFNGFHLKEGDTDEHGPLIAQHLAAANLASVRQRYPDSGNELPGPIEVEDDTHYLLLCRQASRRLIHYMPAVDMLKACDCWEYQSCEAEGWETSKGAFWCNAIRKTAIGKLPGYPEADGWTLRDPNPPLDLGQMPAPSEPHATLMVLR